MWDCQRRGWNGFVLVIADKIVTMTVKASEMSSGFGEGGDEEVVY